MATLVQVNDLLDGHVVLDLECLDRVYLNAYVPNLQVSGQVVNFMRDHLGCPIPSPAIMTRIGDRFRAAVTAFAESADVPMIRFKADDRKIDVVRPYWQRATGPGVVAIGVAQEFQRVFTARQRPTRDPSVKLFGFDKADRRVTVYYFYVLDADFGPGFIKICSYFPAPRGALIYPPRSGVGLEVISQGAMADLDSKEEGDNSMVRHEAPDCIPG